jgi:hypothetical protein
MDDDLALALQLAAADARRRRDQPLLLERTGNNSEQAIPRQTLEEPLHHHFAGRNGRVSPGHVSSHGALDQFSDAFAPMIERHGVAGAICGYSFLCLSRLLCARLETNTNLLHPPTSTGTSPPQTSTCCAPAPPLSSPQAQRAGPGPASLFFARRTWTNFWNA